MTFSEMGLHPRVLDALVPLGYETPTPIQEQAIPHVLKGRDVMGIAQTGTGKTAAFSLPLVHHLANNPMSGQKVPRVLVLTPTRELAAQIDENVKSYAQHVNVRTAIIFGGVSQHKQVNQLRKGVDVLVATPGRLLDLCNQRLLSLEKVEFLVLDEADTMLDMGFIPQVKRIVRSTPRKEYRQTLLFSATFSPDIMNLARQWTFDPITVEIEPERVATENVEQRVYLLESRDRLNVLKRILAEPDATSVIVFANRRDQVRRVYERLNKQGLECGILSGDVAQVKRTKTLERFKTGRIRVLIATDVAGRGIHVDGVSHVINYDLPEDPEDYVHRIGRTGRAGEKGISISFASEDDAFLLPEIEALLGEPLKCSQVPEELLAD